MRKLVVSLMLGLLVLTGCATSSTTPGGAPNTEEARQAAIAEQYGQVFILMTEDLNSVTNRMFLGMLKAGNTRTSTMLTQSFINPPKAGVPFAISGTDEAIAAATLERSLKDGKGEIDGIHVIFMGDQQYWENLETLAQEANVTIDFLEYPVQ